METPQRMVCTSPIHSTRAAASYSEADWVVDKGNIINTNSSGGELGLLLTETNGGTRLSSTRYLHYGTITARSKPFTTCHLHYLANISF